MTSKTCQWCGFTPPTAPKNSDKPAPYDSKPLFGRPRLGGPVVRMCRSCKGVL